VGEPAGVGDFEDEDKGGGPGLLSEGGDEREGFGEGLLAGDAGIGLVPCARRSGRRLRRGGDGIGIREVHGRMLSSALVL
jgi:hypothetical protein